MKINVCNHLVINCSVLLINFRYKLATMFLFFCLFIIIIIIKWSRVHTQSSYRTKSFFSRSLNYVTLGRRNFLFLFVFVLFNVSYSLQRKKIDEAAIRQNWMIIIDESNMFFVLLS